MIRRASRLTILPLPHIVVLVKSMLEQKVSGTFRYDDRQMRILGKARDHMTRMNDMLRLFAIIRPLKLFNCSAQTVHIRCTYCEFIFNYVLVVLFR
jgi:hypothetical protein